MTKKTIELTVNSEAMTHSVEPRLLLSDFIRVDLGLTGTHVGCEHGVCGACTVLLDGVSVRSCLTFAVQADGCVIETVESLAQDDALSPLQNAFRDAYGLQCGFCTPGFLMTATELLRTVNCPGREEVREALSGNLCRCTGYETIIDAVEAAGRAARGDRP
ncbi:(2Fe-2S)-binding protein [Tardiphaga sp. 862_B3_N4_1]|uniref:(2Fe-2S)-binding protein n=1 Tax=Tardiphaga sp. 862_B3_N4_1 TaxID=3240764 RepID=UPI003F2508C5